jgi:rhomboid protease GluP
MEWALVLEATGVPHQVQRATREWAVLVDEADLGRALQQLDAYDKEMAHWSADADEPAPALRGAVSCLVYAGVLSFVHHAQVHGTWALPWTDAGKIDGGLIRQGEWWRVVTALTLHADLTHLMGNLVFGALYAVFTCQMLGTGLGWCAILLAGALGNATNVWLQAPTHMALGASTAVFAALGIVVAYQWRRRRHMRQGRLRRWAPLAVGLFMLGWFGQSGDVLAHVMGFAWGVILGALLGVWRARAELPDAARQRGLAVVPLVVVALCWWLALRPGAG